MRLSEAIQHYGSLEALHAAEASGRTVRTYDDDRTLGTRRCAGLHDATTVMEVHPDLLAPLLDRLVQASAAAPWVNPSQPEAEAEAEYNAMFHPEAMEASVGGGGTSAKERLQWALDTGRIRQASVPYWQSRLENLTTSEDAWAQLQAMFQPSGAPQHDTPMTDEEYNAMFHPTQ